MEADPSLQNKPREDARNASFRGRGEEIGGTYEYV
jgi:hypothetical protein